MAANSLNYNAINVLPERFWIKVNKTDSCWLWTGKIDDGYGRFSIGDRLYLVHRLAFAVMKSKLSTNTQVDHLCKVRNCLNPEHLEEVTSKENTRRGLVNVFNTDPNKCPYGHEYDVEIPGKAEGVIYKNCSKCHKARYAKRRLVKSN